MPQPSVEQRAAQPYVGIPESITMSTFDRVVQRLDQLAIWMAAHGVEPSGPAFVRYRVIDMDRELLVEAGVPVAGPAAGDGDVVAGVLPAGNYATVTHTGHPDELIGVTGDLLAWAERAGLDFDRWDDPRGDAWACRVESYLTDPDEEPDMTKWETTLFFRLADPQP